MRIDYSEPRRSYTSSSPSNLRSSGGGSSKTSIALIAVVAAGFLFAAGFATGWYFSQISAKKAFRAAMEQKSLENSPKEDKKTAPPIQPIAPPVTGPAQPQTSGASQPQGLPATPQASASQNSTQQPAAQTSAPQNPQPLTFYKNLQTGQKNTVLGSGINEKPRPAATPQQVSQTAAQQPKAPPHTGGYVVQVAAYKAFEEAKKLKKDLTDKGYTDVNVSEATLNDNVTWYRVRIGRHLDKEAATKIANKLLSSAKVLPDQD